MGTGKRKYLCTAMVLLVMFACWTAAVCRVDARPIGPQGSVVGFAALNRQFHDLTGVNMALYTITDWLGLVPVGICFGFALLGLVQWIRRKQLRKVDRSLLVLGCFDLVVLAAYLLFEQFVVNYRPVLMDGFLEASYPSSTTMLVLCVMPTAMLQLCVRIKKAGLRRAVLTLMVVFTVFMVVGRLLSGVHWLTDIVGGVLLSAGLVMLYVSFF